MAEVELAIFPLRDVRDAYLGDYSTIGALEQTPAALLAFIAPR